MIIENINAQNQLIRHLETSIQEYKQNTTRGYIYFDIDKLHALLINNSFIDLLTTEASLDDPNMQIWADNHDKIRELFADKIEAIASRNQISFLDTTNLFLTHIHNNVNTYMHVMPVWYMYLFKYLICQSIIKVNAVSKINLNHVALFYNLFQRHYIKVEGHEPEFIQCMRLIVTCQIEHMKNTVTWVQKNNPANVYYSQTVMVQLEQQASNYFNIDFMQKEQEKNVNNDDKNVTVSKEQKYVQDEETKHDDLQSIIKQVRAEKICDESLLEIDIANSNEFLLKKDITLQNYEELTQEKVCVPAAIEIKNNKPRVQNVLNENYNIYSTKVDNYIINDQKNKKSYASLKDDDLTIYYKENPDFVIQTDDEHFEENQDAKTILIEEDNCELIKSETKKQNYLSNAQSKKSMFFKHNYKSKKRAIKQKIEPDIYETIKITKELQTLSDECGKFTYESIKDLKDAMNVSLIQEYIEKILKYDPFSFYKTCVSIAPPLQDSILVKLCGDEIITEFDNKFKSLDLDTFSSRLSKKIKSILYKKYSEFEITTNANDRNEELLPYINFLNSENEPLLITYLRFSGSVDENLLMYVMKNMSNRLIPRLDNKIIVSMCGFLFLHAIALEYHALNLNLVDEFTACVIKFSAHEHITRVLSTNYLYTFDWFVILKGLGAKEDNVFFNEKIWNNFVERQTRENNIQDELNQCLVDIFLYYPESYEELSKKFIEKISKITQKFLIIPEISEMKEIIELRCIEYLNMYNNVIVTFIENANHEQLSLIITEKTLKAKNFILENQSLFNLLLHSAVVLDEKIQKILKEKIHLFTPEIVNSENKYAYIDKNGDCVSSPDIMPLICDYEQIDSLDKSKKKSNDVKMIFYENQKVVNQVIHIFMKNISCLPQEIIHNIKPEMLTKNIIFNKEEQLSLFILLCIYGHIDILDEYKEFIEFLKNNFNNLTCMNEHISYLQMLMFSKKGVKFYEDHDIANVLKPNAFNIEYSITGFKIGPANLVFPHLLCPTAGMMFILSNAFTEEELLEKNNIFARIDKEILEAKLPLTDELRKTTNRGRNVLKVKDMLRTEKKEKIIEKIKSFESKSKCKNKLTFY